MVRITGNPQAMEENRKFSGDRHDGSSLAVFPAPFEPSTAPAFEITVWAKTSQQILSPLDQQRTELFVAGFADPTLLLNRAGLVATWCQTEIGRYISRMSEPPWVRLQEFLISWAPRSDLLKVDI